MLLTLSQNGQSSLRVAAVCMLPLQQDMDACMGGDMRTFYGI